MEIWLAVIIAVLCCVIIVLAVKLRLVRKAAHDIDVKLSELLSAETNTLIDIHGRDKNMALLASSINKQLRLLRDERQRFERGDAELKEAVTNISHDLRTPLTAICGYLDLLQAEEKSDEVERYISHIQNRTEALKALTEELFRYSVVSSTREYSPEPLNLCGVLEESLVSFYGAMRQKSISPVVSIPDKRIERNLDKTAVSRIFGNIITNALKYSDGDFEITMNESGTIVFANTAASLTPITAGRLFDRFFTVETGRNSTGLGLSIAKLLTEKMGGKVTADFKEQRLYITVDFPAQQD